MAQARAHRACSGTLKVVQRARAKGMRRAERPSSGRSASRAALDRLFSTLLLLLVVLSCTSGAMIEPHVAALEPISPLAVGEHDSLGAAQRASLSYVFYRDNAMPRPPRDRELRRLDRDFAEAPPAEVEELRALFGDDRELLVYATRDSDGDGILDYRISEYHGKFFEGDLDVDGDGVRNVLDSHPYDPKHGGRDRDGDGAPDEPGSFADRDGDGLPDHLDWSRRKAEPMPTLQMRLFHDFDVVLVERSERFTPELVRAVDDVLRVVYRKPMPTLRTIAVEDQLLLVDDKGDNGFMVGQTQTLTLYARTIEGAPPLVLLGLVAHEVDHAWQMALDFDAGNLAAENVRIHYPAGRFAKLIEPFGWTAETKSLGGNYVHQLYWPHFFATSPKYEYRGESTKAWQAWIDEIAAEVGGGFLSDPRLANRNVIGPYSMTSPWEWHADHMMASLYIRMDRSIAKHPNPAVARSAGLLRLRMFEAVHGQWGRYDYRNAAGSGIDDELARRFPLRDAELRKLVDRYVVSLVELPVLARALELDEATGLPREGLVQLWQQLAGELELPLDAAARGAADLTARIRDEVRSTDAGLDAGETGDGETGDGETGDGETGASETGEAAGETGEDAAAPPRPRGEVVRDAEAAVRDLLDLVRGTPSDVLHRFVPTSAHPDEGRGERGTAGESETEGESETAGESETGLSPPA